MKTDFDVIVVGAGHAGVEACRVLSMRGHRVALVTLRTDRIAAMSCNPAIGGVGKSHLVFEIDSLGGWMGQAADANSIQSRRLNMNKGPAVRSTRVQCDKNLYANWMRKKVESLKNLTILKAEVESIRYAKSILSRKVHVQGVQLGDGSFVRARAVILSTGTFMRGLMFCGEEKEKGGRVGDKAADSLTDSLLRVGHSTMRLKTGTPARLDARTIDFDSLEKQWGDAEQRQFSWKGREKRLPQLCCYITRSNSRTHEIIEKNFHRSPLYSGEIEGVGPRYCPSIEDKVRRFPDRTEHQIFLEPEGLNTDFVYPNGMSTSLPANVQLEFFRSIKGLENVQLKRPGYAVEYDSIDPTELKPSLMSQFAEGLFLAGQINRSSGYEEAAAQGLWAGVNASLYLKDRVRVAIDRSRSYIDTLVDDLTTKGSQEPYRMFTSRSEYRLLLREDNASERMFQLASELGLLDEEQKKQFERRQRAQSTLKEVLMKKRMRIDQNRVQCLFDYLKRPEVSWETLLQEGHLEAGGFEALVAERIEIEAKYSGYLQRQELELKRYKEVQGWYLDDQVDWEGIPALSSEIKEKLSLKNPKSVVELSQISGMTPSALLSIVKVAGRKTSNVSRETIGP